MRKIKILFFCFVLAASTNDSFAQRQAQAVATVLDGRVASIAIIDGGSGYVSAPTVSVVGGGGFGAEAIALITNGAVSRIDMQSPGANYASIPTVIISPPIDFADGLIGWWRGEGNANDELGKNDGQWIWSPFYGDGMVGKCFIFGILSVGNSQEFNFGNGSGDFTIEAWVVVYPVPNTDGAAIISKGNFSPKSGWAFYMDDNGKLSFANYGAWELHSAEPIFTSTSWYHVAVTKNKDTITLFSNGSIVGITTNQLKSLSETDVLIGGIFVEGGLSSTGLIDELAIYNRALTEAEIKEVYDLGSSGKYIRPIIIRQPQNLVGYWGKSGSLAVEAIGTGPMQYQWLKNGQPIAGATNSAMGFAAIQFTDSGNYSVVVNNQYGSAASQESVLDVQTAGVRIGLVPKLTIEGVSGQRYGIEYATNLNEPVRWTTITNITLTQPIEAWYDFETDTTSGDKPQRFYRVIPAP